MVNTVIPSLVKEPEMVAKFNDLPEEWSETDVVRVYFRVVNDTLASVVTTRDDVPQFDEDSYRMFLRIHQRAEKRTLMKWSWSNWLHGFTRASLD